MLPRAAVGVSRAPADAFLGLPAAPHSIRSDRAEAWLNRGGMGTPDAFAVNGRSVRLRLGDRETTVQLNANGTGKSAQTWRRIPHTDASGVARGGRLACDLAFRGADGLDRSPPPAPDALPDPDGTFQLALENASLRHSAALLPISRAVGRCAARLRPPLPALHGPYRALLSCAGALPHRPCQSPPTSIRFHLGRPAARLARCACALLAGSAAVSAFSMRIVVTNDDDFEAKNLQALFAALKSAGHEVILSAPYSDQSGTSAQLGSFPEGARTGAPSPGRPIAAGSPAVGPTTLADDQYYVDGFPATAARYGIDVLAPAKWGAAPDVVISGPNIGNNLGIITPRSGTVGAAITALNRGVPALAVSGADRNPLTAPLLAALTLRLLAALEHNGKVALPAGIGLNINAPPLDPRRTAASYRVAFTHQGSGPAGETSVFAEGNIVTVTPIQGTFLAPPELAAQVLTRMRGLFASAPAVTNPKMTNLSIRGYVGVGSALQIAGFVVSGTVAKTLLLRANGPSLALFGIADPSPIPSSNSMTAPTASSPPTTTGATTRSTPPPSSPRPPGPAPSLGPPRPKTPPSW